MTMAVEPRSALERLVESLRRLSASSDDQLAYLRSVGDSSCVDELALEFDDACRGVGMLVRAGVISSDIGKQVEQLSERLDRMSGEAHEALWTPEQLMRAEEWSAVRREARLALRAVQSLTDGS